MDFGEIPMDVWNALTLDEQAVVMAISDACEGRKTPREMRDRLDQIEMIAQRVNELKFSLCTPIASPFGGGLSPYREIEVPEGTDELRLALVKGYDGPKIIHEFYKDGEPFIPGQKGEP